MTRDLDDPGSSTLVGKGPTVLHDDSRDVDLTTGAGNELLFQLAPSAIDTIPGQVDRTTGQQS